MTGAKQTKPHLGEELGLLRQRVEELEQIVAEHERREQVLHEGQENLQALFDSTNDFLFVLDNAGMILQVNRVVCERLGYSQSELRGMNVAEVHPPDKREETQAIMADLVARKTSSCPIPLQCRDGSLIPVETRVAQGKWGKRDVLFGISRDITERKQVEEELRASEERLRAQYKAIPIPIYTWQSVGEDLVLIDHNDAAVTITRGGIASYLGTKATELYADCPEILEELRRCAAERTSIEREMLYRLQTTGESKHLAVKYAFAPPDQVLVHTEDITEHKRAEEALRESEEKYRTLFDNAGTPITYYALDGAILLINPVGAKNMGGTPDDFVGRSLYEFFPDIAEMIKERTRQTIETGKGSDYGDLIELPSGSCWFHSNFQPVRNAAGEIFAIQIVSQDITECKLAEDMLLIKDSALRSSISAVVIADLDGHLEYVNPAFLRMWGYEKEEEVLGRSVVDLWEPQEKAGEAIQALRDRGDWSGELTAKRKDQSLIRVSLSASMVTDPTGQPIRMMSSFMDISEKAQAEEAKRAAEQELEEQRIRAIRSDRLHSLGEIATAIAHELNQPLLGVRGLAEHLLLGQKRGWKISQEKTLEKLELIVEQTERMTSIIEHIRKFSSGVVSGEKLPVEVNDVIDSSIRLIGDQLPTHGLSLECELGENLPPVLANPFLLEEVVLNLISNARDAVEERSKSEPEYAQSPLVLRTFLDDGGSRGRVVIEVIDRGVGISPSILTKVFDPFFTTKGPDHGTGLGLAISKSIIEDFHGTIDIQGNSGGGATVRVSLPVLDNDSGDGKNGD